MTEDRDQCEWPGHTTVSLEEDRGREELLQRTWGSKPEGPPPLSIVVAPVAIVGGGGLGLSLSPGGFRPADLTYILVGAGLGLAAFLLFWWRRHPPWTPVGAREERDPPAGPGRRGRASAGEADGTQLAFSMVLRPSSGAMPTMVIERSHGFVLTSDDGTTVEVPEGRVRIAAEPRHRSACSREDVLREVRRVDPVRTNDSLPAGRDPIPWHHVEFARVVEGDEIEVVAELERLPPSGNTTGYRDGGERRLVAVGVPAIRIVDRLDP